MGLSSEIKKVKDELKKEYKELENTYNELLHKMEVIAYQLNILNKVLNKEEQMMKKEVKVNLSGTSQNLNIEIIDANTNDIIEESNTKISNYLLSKDDIEKWLRNNYEDEYDIIILDWKYWIGSSQLL